ncbi:MAG: hypothetical protein AAF741_08365 [Bacteroidota bacterium]
MATKLLMLPYFGSMSLSGILPMLLCSLVFVAVGLLLRTKNKVVAAVIGLIGLVLTIHSVGIFTNDRGDKLAAEQFEALLENFEEEDIWPHFYDEASDQELMLASLTSMALYRGALRFPDYEARAVGVMRALADWVTDTKRFPVWKMRTSRAREVFFLAHAACIIGHYQHTSKDETYSDEFQRSAEYLGRNMTKSPYKMLVSRPTENLFRPADNAVGIYAISLYDGYYATQFLTPTMEDWLKYVASELTYRESRLPCSSFSETDRCRYAPNATSLGIAYAYLAAATPDVPEGVHTGYKEWAHYFKKRNLSPYTLQIRTLPRGQSDPNSCNIASAPLGCERYENAVGLWISAEHQGWYTYGRLLNGLRLRATFGQKTDYSRWTPRQRVVPLTRLAIESIGLLHAK